MPRQVALLSIRWEREAIPQIRHLAISGSHIAKFSLPVQGSCRDKVSKFPKDLRVTLDMSMVGQFHQGNLDIIMAVSPRIKWQPGTHDAVPKPVHCATLSAHRLAQAIFALW